MCKPKFGEPAFSCEFGCAIFVHLTVWSSHMQSCRTHPTIGTTHWFSYLYTKHKSLSFGQTTLCQSFQVVHMSCICQFHHRCNHPQNHWHHPMVCEFAGLNNYLYFSEAPTFCPNHTFQSHQVVPMPCICQCHQRCNHPNNHMHYPMNLKFGSLKEHFLFWQVYSLFKSGRFFAVNTPSTPTFALNLCCFWNFSLLSRF